MPNLIRGNSRNSRFVNSNNIYAQAFKLVEIPLGIFRENFTHYINQTNKNYLLLNNNGKTVLGFAFVKNTNPTKMNYVTLLGTQTGKGYGRQIMNAIYSNAVNRNRRGVRINFAVNAARPFYSKLGYVPVPNSPSNMVKLVPKRRSPSK